MIPQCSCCGNAYDTRWLCADCRADPANADWYEGREDITENDYAASSDKRPPWNESAARWRPSRRFCRVVEMLVEGVSQTQIAKQCGCSRQYVTKIAAEVGLNTPRASLGPSARSRARDVLMRVRAMRLQEHSHGGGVRKTKR